MSFSKKEKPTGFSPDKKTEEMVRSAAQGGLLACAAAFRLSEKTGLSTREIGTCADYFEIRLVSCQIGLFGNGKKGKAIRPLETVDSAVKETVLAASDKNGIDCEAVFRIADETGLKKRDIGRLCQTIGIKIRNCRLGAF